MKRIAVLVLGIAALTALAGCGSEKAAPLTKAESSQMSAPLGQPMPPEAKAAMEKAGKPNGR